ncbi:hypothetical protein LZ30DRAFT_699198 [Colletotrichum cereale]|nr:hypothetical protein LZ30DRAFT_699198 [Colletotrichum cereale]
MTGCQVGDIKSKMLKLPRKERAEFEHNLVTRYELVTSVNKVVKDATMKNNSRERKRCSVSR